MNSRARITTAALLTALLLGCSTAPLVLDLPDDPPLTIADLQSRPVIGSLGIPLGTVAEIKAKIVTGREIGDKRHAGRYVLRVTEVDGKAREEGPMMDFEVPAFVNAHIAADELALYKLKEGKDAGSLNKEEIADLEKGYVDRQVLLAVYESGEFGGIPRNLPKDVPVWQGRAFSFNTHLVVLAERPSSPPRDRAHD